MKSDLYILLVNLTILYRCEKLKVIRKRLKRLKKVAVLQSNYIPWKGYFDIIHDVDEFIFHDDLQYTKNDWRNRNKILVQGKPVWLTIPVGANENRLIIDVEMQDKSWQKKHWLTLKMAYGRLPGFKLYEDFFYNVYMEREWQYLYELNRYLIEKISQDYLGIKTKFSDSRDYQSHGKKNEKLLSLLQSANTNIYVSGPAAKDYIIPELYDSAGIKIVWKDYDGYPIYNQNSQEFAHYVSILDLLFNTGKDSPYYIWGWREELK